jgi:hypothetical protein
MSHQYLLPCSCGRSVRVANAQAGGEVQCVCGKSLSVPTLRGLRALAPAPAEASSKVTLGWSPVHGVIFATALLAVTVGVALVAYHLWRYGQIANAGLTVDHSSHFVEHEALRIDQMSPEQTLDEWSDIRETGLGDKMTPIWIAAKQKMAEYMLWLKIGAAAIVTGATVAVATLFIGRK